MIRALPPSIEPATWVLAFHRTSPYWWVRLLALGRYKHVSAFAWVGTYGMWVWYSITLTGTQIILLADSPQAQAWLMAQTADADLVSVPRQPRARRAMIAPFYCVPAIKHLLGLRSGALLPCGLYDHVLANGGELVTDGRARATDAEPRAVAPAGASQG